MTRKDYVLLANSLNASLNAARKLEFTGDAGMVANSAALGAVNATIRNMATALATDNPRFDRERFIAAAMK